MRRAAGLTYSGARPWCGGSGSTAWARPMASHLRPGRAEGMKSVGIASRPAPEFFMEVLLPSTAVVALAEIGDKTQLLAILLATRFRRPTTIILGLLVEKIGRDHV